MLSTKISILTAVLAMGCITHQQAIPAEKPRVSKPKFKIRVVVPPRRDIFQLEKQWPSNYMPEWNETPPLQRV